MIFLYHGIVPDTAPPARSSSALAVSAFRRHADWLSRRFRFLPLAEYVEGQRTGTLKGAAALTFDDVIGATFPSVAPVLRELSLPATFFATADASVDGRVPWFAFLDALCFESAHPSIRMNGLSLSFGSLRERRSAREVLRAAARESGDPVAFVRVLRERYPLPADLVPEYLGMSVEDVQEASRDPLFEVGSHSLTHPYLSLRPEAEQETELRESRRLLSLMTGRPVRFFAYPAGDYDRRTLDLVRGTGYDAAFATIPLGLEPHGRFEIARTGVYSPSLLKVVLKAKGAVALARTFGVRVG